MLKKGVKLIKLTLTKISFPILGSAISIKHFYLQGKECLVYFFYSCFILKTVKIPIRQFSFLCLVRARRVLRRRRVKSKRPVLC